MKILLQKFTFLGDGVYRLVNFSLAYARIKYLQSDEYYVYL